MTPIRILAFSTTAALALQASGASAQVTYMPADVFADSPTGKLVLSMELSGRERNTFPNGVEWAQLTVNRTLQLTISMLNPGPVGGPSLTLGGVAPGESTLPPGAAALQASLEACGEDQGCARKVMMDVMRTNPELLTQMQPDVERYETWIADRRGPCADGQIDISDVGEGVNIAPPDPAAPYKFERIGQLVLPLEEIDIVEAICSAEIAVDRQQGLLSLRLPAGRIPVPVSLSGDAFTDETQVFFLEDYGNAEILDQPIAADATEWSGDVLKQDFGTVSHNSGQVVVPVTAKISWRFTRD